MDTVEALKAENDILKAHNERLKGQNAELTADLSRRRTGGELFGGGPAGTVSRNVFQAMTPGAQAMFSKAGGRVVD